MKSIQLKKTALSISLVFAVVLTLGISAQAETKVSGFVDAQYGWDSDGAPAGFTVNDGAVYFNATGDMANATLDIPFAGGGATPAFTIAGAKTQAYVGKKYDMGLSWAIGQWDTIWGMESQDSVALFFAKNGQIDQRILASVHTGLLLGYKFTEMVSLNVVVANSEGAGTGTGTDYNYAGQLMYKGDSVWFKGGYSFQAMGADTSLIDVGLGFKAGSLDLGLGFDMKDTGAADNAMGIFGSFILNTSDTCGYGLRFEYISKVAGYADTGILGTLGANSKMTKDLTAKLNYTFSSITAVAGGTSATGHALDLAAVYAF